MTVYNPVFAQGIELETNGTPNGDQTLLNLVQGSNVTITDNGTGTVTIDAAGGGGSPGGANSDVQFNNSGTFGGDSGFTYDGSGDVTIGNTLFVPTVSSPSTGSSISVANGILYDNGSANALDWNNKVLELNSVATLDWGNFRTIDALGSTFSMNWNDRTLIDSVGGLSLDWHSHWLQLNGQTTLDWENHLLQSSSGNISLNWDAGTLGEPASGFPSIVWGLRQLIAADASTVIMDWSNSTTAGLYNFVGGKLTGDGTGLTGVVAGAGGSNTDVQYNNSGVLAGDSNFTYDGSGNAFLSNQLQVPFIKSSTSGHSIVMTTALLLDSSGTTTSVDWQNRILRTTGGDFSVTWDARQGYGSNGNTDVSIDWADRKLYYWNSAAPSLTIDWAACTLLDQSGTLSLDWNAHALFDSGGVIQSLDWLNRNTLDGAGLRSTDWSTRYLYTSDGSTIIMDWSNITTAGNYNFVSGVLTTSSGLDSSISGNVSIAGTTGETFVWTTNASAPIPQGVIALPLSAFGSGTINQVLGTPDMWALVNVAGTDYKLPLYL